MEEIVTGELLRTAVRQAESELATGVGMTPWDFDLYADTRDLHFQFCHHDEVHVRSSDAGLREQFWKRWEARGYSGRWMNSDDEPS